MIRFQKINKKAEKISSKEKIPMKKKNNSSKFVLVALDTCVVIDLAFSHKNFKKMKASPTKKEYLNALQKLLERNVLSKKNKNGNICFCITPEVVEELTKNKKKYYGRVKNFVESNIISFHMENEMEAKFSQKVDSLVEQYCAKGYFLDKDNLPTVDGINVAQASYYNLYLLSNDHHICTYKKERDPKKKIEDIRQINKENLNHDYRSIVAVPQRPEQFLKLLNSGKRMAQPKHLEELTLNARSKISANVPKSSKLELFREF